jgi:hypothetical protein
MKKVFKPLNRHLLVQKKEEPELSATDKVDILLPDGYKTQKSGYETVRLVRAASDCKLNFKNLGRKIVVQSAMIETLELDGETHHIILENYVVGGYKIVEEAEFQTTEKR